MVIDTGSCQYQNLFSTLPTKTALQRVDLCLYLKKTKHRDVTSRTFSLVMAKGDYEALPLLCPHTKQSMEMKQAKWNNGSAEPNGINLRFGHD